MANDNSNTFLGVIVGALLIAVVGVGGFLFLGHKPGPSAPSVSVSLPTPSPAPSSPTH